MILKDAIILFCQNLGILSLLLAHFLLRRSVWTTEVALTQHPRLAPQMVVLEMAEDDEDEVDEEVDNGGSSDTGIHSTPSALHLR